MEELIKQYKRHFGMIRDFYSAALEQCSPDVINANRLPPLPKTALKISSRTSGAFIIIIFFYSRIYLFIHLFHYFIHSFVSKASFYVVYCVVTYEHASSDSISFQECLYTCLLLRCLTHDYACVLDDRSSASARDRSCIMSLSCRSKIK